MAPVAALIICRQSEREGREERKQREKRGEGKERGREGKERRKGKKGRGEQEGLGPLVKIIRKYMEEWS